MLPLCFGFPPPRISDKFLRLREKFSQFHLLPKNFSIFPISLHFPLFRPTLLFPPTFTNFLPVFFNGILHTLCVFRFPYFDHDAFMHNTMHVLDAPGFKDVG